MSKHSKKSGRGGASGRAAGAALLAVLAVVLGFFIVKNGMLGGAMPQSASQPPNSAPPSSQVTPPTAAESNTPEPTPSYTPEPTPTPEPFRPYAVESTMPEKYILSTDIMVEGVILEPEPTEELPTEGEAAESPPEESEAPAVYEPAETISFGSGEDYAAVRGITTFRGNNYRDGGTYGFSTLSEGKFADNYWNVSTGTLIGRNSTVWTGSGWTGQPLIVQWPRETKDIMTSMYPSAREKEGLVEVIYATMDGYIYFLDLDSGERTRDPLYLGYAFKGSGSLDPRGYPILYVGGGYDSPYEASRAFAVSLIDCKELYHFGNDDSFAHRPWNCFDSAPLIDAETDTLIWPGENGVLYIIKLNTAYDEAAGTLTMDPREVKWRYKSIRAGGQFWLGMECGAVIYEGFAFFADNGGHLMCLDLNTLELVWVQDLLDDTNCTPVLSVEDGHPYLYVSTSFHGGWRAPDWDSITVPIWKVDAETGEFVWENDDYDCFTVHDISGGVQGSMAVGRHDLEGMVFVPISRTPTGGAGVLAALDVGTGEMIWELETLIYSWSSPVMVYTAEGRGYIVYTTTGGYMYLVDGKTGEILGSLNCRSNIEATAAVYNDTVVVGARLTGIFGVKLK